MALLPQVNGEWSRSLVDGAFPSSHGGRTLAPRWLRTPLMLRMQARIYSSLSSHGSRGDVGSVAGDSYLSMWKRAKERQEHEHRLMHGDGEPEEGAAQKDNGHGEVNWEEKSQNFASLLQVPKDKRDRIQRMQVVDRAAAALAAVNALLTEESSFRNSAATLPPSYARSISGYQEEPSSVEFTSNNKTAADLTLGSHATPGPDFWTWAPPPVDESVRDETMKSPQTLGSNFRPVTVLEKDPTTAFLDIPRESMASEDFSFVFQSRAKPSLPPLQSLLEVQEDADRASIETGVADMSVSVPDIAEEVAPFIKQDDVSGTPTQSHGVDANGSPWWKLRGKELRKDGVTCVWTVIRGINPDGTEWEEKFWEAFDDLDYKELGAEKSGRDAYGNVWREFWKEAMWQDLSSGLMHIEKTADKWAKNGYGGEWHEKWWEHYDASGRAEKWADKWCKIDSTTPLDPGHAHVWHERWGEKFDGQGGAMKYTDKWAERAEFDGRWSKWGDKWDENFNTFGNGTKQGETWWEGQSGERWNRTWGEEHNGTGWVHKYGRSSSGEHWDTHEPQATWYERHPHFGFHHCVENSKQLREVGKQTKSGH